MIGITGDRQLIRLFQQTKESKEENQADEQDLDGEIGQVAAAGLSRANQLRSGKGFGGRRWFGDATVVADTGGVAVGATAVSPRCSNKKVTIISTCASLSRIS
jgi:hypothetical protein